MPLRPSDSSRMAEASKLETAVAARRGTLFSGARRVAKRAKMSKPGVPPQICDGL